MDEKIYKHIFVDATDGGDLSNETLKNKTKNSLTNSAKIAKGASKQLTSRVDNRIINPPLDAVTGGLWTPARQIASGVKTGKMAMIGAGAVVIAWKALEMSIDLIQKRIAKLEAEAREKNNTDNLLIRAGSLNIKNATIKTTRRGKDLYYYNKR